MALPGVGFDMARKRKQDWDPPAPALIAFKEKLEKFSASAHDLLEAWDRLDPDLSAAMAEDYPFHKDFMELVGDIHGWKHTVRKIKP